MAGYLPVNVEYDISPEGEVVPMEIIWKGNKRYTIDRIIHVSMPEDKMICFTVLVHGTQRCLFFNGKQWKVSSQN